MTINESSKLGACQLYRKYQLANCKDLSLLRLCEVAEPILYRTMPKLCITAAYCGHIQLISFRGFIVVAWLDFGS